LSPNLLKRFAIKILWISKYDKWSHAWWHKQNSSSTWHQMYVKFLLNFKNSITNISSVFEQSFQFWNISNIHAHILKISIYCHSGYFFTFEKAQTLFLFSFILCISILFLLDAVNIHNGMCYCNSQKTYLVPFKKKKKTQKSNFSMPCKNLYTYILYFAIAFEDLYVAAYHLFTESICIYTFSSFLLFLQLYL